MGTTYYPGSTYPTPAKLAEYAYKGAVEHHYDPAHSVVWTVWRTRPDSPHGVRPIICCDLLKQDGPADYPYGLKPMDESMWPFTSAAPPTFPRDWFDRYPDPELGASTAWRAEVRRYWADMDRAAPAAWRSFARSLGPTDGCPETWDADPGL